MGLIDSTNMGNGGGGKYVCKLGTKRTDIGMANRDRRGRTESPHTRTHAHTLAQRQAA